MEWHRDSNEQDDLWDYYCDMRRVVEVYLGCTTLHELKRSKVSQTSSTRLNELLVAHPALLTSFYSFLFQCYRCHVRFMTTTFFHVSAPLFFVMG